MVRALVNGRPSWGLPLVAVLLFAACKSVPAPAAQAAPPAPVPLDRKVGWILRLEQQRVLRDPAVQAPATPATTLQPAAAPDLEALALDPNAFLRRRALLAIGRVGMPAGQRALMIGLADGDADVRAAAAFGLGLLGLPGVLPPLEGALKDPAPLVRQRAIEALGLTANRCTAEPAWCGLRPPASGDVVLPDAFAAAAAAIAGAAAECPTLMALRPPDDEGQPASPDIEICRAALFSLARLRAYDRLASLTIDAQGRPVSYWWPIAFALQRHADPRAATALVALAGSEGVTTAGFALRGLAALKEPRAVPAALAILRRADANIQVRVAAVRLLGQVAGADAIRPLLDLLAAPATPEPLLLEVIAALGAAHDHQAFSPLLDWLTDPRAAVRSATLAATAAIDPDAFMVVVAGLGRDADWSVRAALATALGTLPADRVTPALEALAADEDARVHGPALEALAAVHAPGLVDRLTAALDAPDFVERAVAARLLGDARPDGGIARLSAAYTRGASDAEPAARAAAVEALARYGGADALAVVRRALADPDWSVRVRAARALARLGEAADPQRPAPLSIGEAVFESEALLHPPFSPHAFIDTTRGSIEIELNVVDATMTARNFVTLARAGFFTGLRLHRVVPAFVVQDGDPRGDGEGGPGYTVRDERSPVPYGRGTVGMALDGPETGGSQWFITLGPQPHLNGVYTAFGQVVGGWDVLDQLAPGDTIDRVRIWDGVTTP